MTRFLAGFIVGAALTLAGCVGLVLMDAGLNPDPRKEDDEW